MAEFILKGNICYSKNKDKLECVEKGYIVCIHGKSKGVYKTVPKEYEEFEVIDMGDNLIIPGLVDLHVHASQYSFRGLGMDMELLDWLNTHAFPEEGKFSDIEYAKKAYSIFTEDLYKSATTRACIFATRHVDATVILMDMLEKTGLKTYVGKVNMDRNAPDYIREENAQISGNDTTNWIEKVIGQYENTFPMLTPRFIPSCTDDLMKRISSLQKEKGLALQSHLSENLGEIELVKNLCPGSRFYGDAYNQFGLFGNSVPTVMAHCVYSDDDEIEMMKRQNVFVAHCPQSNTNIASGIAPARKYLDMGLKVGLGSDIAGGSSLSIFRAVVDAIQVSKLRWRLVDDSFEPLTVAEAFFMATKGGGEFFGKVGGFEDGFELDAIIIDDSLIPYPQGLTIEERLERVVYLSDDRHIVSKFVAGKKLF